MGVATAIAIGAAAASAYAAHKQAGAAKDAAKIQADASNQAGQLQQQNLRDTRAFAAPLQQQAQQRANPYVQLGQGALGNLGQMFNLPQGAPWSSGTQQASPYRPAGSPQIQGMTGGMGATAPAPQAGDPMVTLEAPTGQRKTVPASQVPQFLAKGAKVIGHG